MLRTGLVSLNAESPEKLTAIENWMNSSSKSLFQNFLCDRITHESYPNIWKFLGPNVRTLILSHWWGESRDLTLDDYEDLLLTRCPELQQLVIPATAQFMNSNNFLVSAIDQNKKIKLHLKVKL